MGDDEVGNQNSNPPIDTGIIEDSTSFKLSLETSYATQNLGMNTTVSSADLGGGSALGAAAEGLRFHPAAVGGMSFAASTMDDDEEDHYATPIKTKGTKTEEEDHGGMVTPKRKEKSSPQSVIEGVSGRKSGSQATLMSFPRYQKSRNKNQRGSGGRGKNSKSSPPVICHDSSCSDSETIIYGNDDATAESIMDYDDDIAYIDGLQRALFHSNPLNKFHDFITGNMCWSNDKNALMQAVRWMCR